MEEGKGRAVNKMFKIFTVFFFLEVFFLSLMFPSHNTHNPAAFIILYHYIGEGMLPYKAGKKRSAFQKPGF